MLPWIGLRFPRLSRRLVVSIGVAVMATITVVISTGIYRCISIIYPQRDHNILRAQNAKEGVLKDFNGDQGGASSVQFDGSVWIIRSSTAI